MLCGRGRCLWTGRWNSVSGLIFQNNQCRHTKTEVGHLKWCLQLFYFCLHVPWRLSRGQVRSRYSANKWFKFCQIYFLDSCCFVCEWLTFYQIVFKWLWEFLCSFIVKKTFFLITCWWSSLVLPVPSYMQSYLCR